MFADAVRTCFLLFTDARHLFGMRSLRPNYQNITHTVISCVDDKTYDCTEIFFGYEDELALDYTSPTLEMPINSPYQYIGSLRHENCC